MKNINRQKIYLLGDINIDISMLVDRYPRCGYESFSDQLSSQIGGCVANTAIVLAKMGAPAGLIGCTGNDVWAKRALKPMQALGIDTSQVHQKEGVSTGITFIAVTPDGERTMFSHRGANKALDPQKIPANALAEAAILHISGYAFTESTQKDAALRLVQTAVHSGVPISLDTALAPVLTHPGEFRSLLKELAICILGPRELAVVSGLSEPRLGVEWLLSQGVKLAALKLGDNGCLLANSQEAFSLAAFPVMTVDTTGAGDAFSAGILFGYLHQFDLQSTGVLANALGALAATRQGAGENLPGRAELVKFLQKVGVDVSAFRL